MPDGLACETFAASELVLLLSPDHALADAPEPVEMALIAPLKLILNEPRIGYDRAVLETFDARGLTPNIVAVCDNLDSVKLMVSAGAGAALVPRIAIGRELEAGTLAARRIVPSHEVMLLLVRREEPLPPRIARCVAELGERLRTSP